MNHSNDEFLRLLLLLDYSTECRFYSYDDHGVSVFRKAVKEKNVKIGLDDSILFYFLPKEKALEFDIKYVVVELLINITFFHLNFEFHSCRIESIQSFR